MNTKLWLPCAIVVMLLYFTTGCGHEATYRVVLGKMEQVSESAPVLVDGIPAGFVKELRQESGERVAVLAITDGRIAQEKLKLGIVRVIEDGQIRLCTDSVRPDSAGLRSGAFIPTQSTAEFTVKKYATKQTCVLLGLAIVVVLVLGLFFKSGFKLGLVIVCLVMAGLTGWILHPHLVLHIEKLYASSPDVNQNVATNEANPAPENHIPVPLKQWEAMFVQILQHRPNPCVAAFAAIFVLSFVLYAILFGAAIRALRRTK